MNHTELIKKSKAISDKQVRDCTKNDKLTPKQCRVLASSIAYANRKGKGEK